MGNHEYCIDCGENDFHLHRPCDPAKVAARKAEENRINKKRINGKIELKSLQKKLEKEGFKTYYDNGNLVVINYF